MGWITTHVLDTAAGRPAAELKVVLTRLDGDGRVTASGQYEITFYVGDYFRRAGVTLADPPFLDVVPVRFGVTEDAHYHVPLLVSPYAYSTYRGS